MTDLRKARSPGELGSRSFLTLSWSQSKGSVTKRLEGVHKELLKVGLTEEESEEILQEVTAIIQKKRSQDRLSKSRSDSVSKDVAPLSPPSPRLSHLYDQVKLKFSGETDTTIGELFRDILESEREYVDGLGTVMEMWVHPMRDKQYKDKGLNLDKEERTKLFSNIDIIYELHRDILREMEMVPPEDVGIFFAQKIPTMKLYSQYIDNWPTANAIIRSRDYFAKNSNGVKLAGYLAMPLSRMDVYLAQFENIDEKWPNESHQKKAVVNTITLIKDLLLFFSQYQQESENSIQINSILRILTNCPADCVIRGKTLVKQGDLILFVKSKKKHYRFFLFTDVLMYARLQTLPTRQLKYKGQIDLKKSEVISRSQSFSTSDLKSTRQAVKPSSPVDIKNAIQILGGPGHMMSICANTFQERDAWLVELLNAVASLNEKRVFGVNLIELLSRPQHNKDGVPLLLRQAVEYFSDELLETEGLFRMDPQRRELEALREAIDSGAMIDFSTEKNPHLVTGLIKLFFRELPEPLFTYNLYEPFLSAANKMQVSDKIEAIKPLLTLLPPHHYNVTQYIVSFFRRISETPGSKMTPGNLGIVMEPSLLKSRTFDSPHSSRATFPAMGESLLTILIENYEEIFEN
eukprot:TRINITY_DN10158_c0_g1_i2.p1 TRINITY_DN10158_c0_g1~~TRINITY_DN10158_c0_g1_i2.p1  ORF type:complete len:633 (+),score=182.81 TRINITY_DN10158_c0_g1_i2:10-1908(+)